MPSMTPGRAALVGLMHRYLSGLLDPFVSPLEVHKLMYFMQEAGQPLRLRYAKGPYGPYAENLSHILNAIEGHMVSGYADGGDTPDKHLELVPGAAEVADAFLSQHAAACRAMSVSRIWWKALNRPTGWIFCPPCTGWQRRKAPPMSRPSSNMFTPGTPTNASSRRANWPLRRGS